MKRILMARLLSQTGVLQGVLRARRHLPFRFVTVLTYHRVAWLDRVGELDPDIIDADPALFAEQLDFLAQYFTFVTINDLVAHLRGKPLPPNPLLLTFDDGYREDISEVLPMLQARKLRATFFIATAYPEAGRLYWWDRLALYLRRSKNEQVRLERPLRVTLHPQSDLAGAAARILYLIKRTVGFDPESLWKELSRATGVVIDPDEERELALATIMGWDEIAALAACGMDIESHTHRHRVLGTMSLGELEADLAISRETLESRLGFAPRALAYPVGHVPSQAHRDVVRRVGFQLAFTNATGISVGRILDPYVIPRIAMDRTLVTDMFKAVVTVPYLSASGRVSREPPTGPVLIAN
jgi:peptidoglycan/xylan/chitin deacetylase (PgdA/CDA1 family)